MNYIDKFLFVQLYGNMNGFNIDQLSSKVIITFKKLGVVFEYDNSADAWEITVPAKFSAKTEGLCGMADTDASNDLWVGGYSVPSTKSDAVETFFNHWLVNPSPICYTNALAGADNSLAASRDFCTKVRVKIHMLPVFSNHLFLLSRNVDLQTDILCLQCG